MVSSVMNTSRSPPRETYDTRNIMIHTAILTSIASFRLSGIGKRPCFRDSFISLTTHSSNPFSISYFDGILLPFQKNHSMASQAQSSSSKGCRFEPSVDLKSQNGSGSLNRSEFGERDRIFILPLHICLLFNGFDGSTILSVLSNISTKSMMSILEKGDILTNRTVSGICSIHYIVLSIISMSSFMTRNR